MKSSDLNHVAQRLDIIANLLTVLVAEREQPPSVTSRIMLLHDAGLGPADIGRIIGKSTQYVGSVTSQKKKAAKKEPRSNG